MMQIRNDHSKSENLEGLDLETQRKLKSIAVCCCTGDQYLM
jgi:hypothetical protein